MRHLQNWQILLVLYDLNEYTKGSGELTGLHSQTIQTINETHAKASKTIQKGSQTIMANQQPKIKA